MKPLIRAPNNVRSGSNGFKTAGISTHTFNAFSIDRDVSNLAGKAR